VVVRALDLFGARYVDYSPGTAREALDPLVPIRGTRDQDLSDMAQDLSGQGRQFLANATEMISPTTATELRSVLIQARRTLQQLGNAGEQPSAELTRTLASLRQVFQRMDLLLAQNTTPANETMAHVRDASASLAQVTQTLTRTSATLDSLMTKINSGRGAVGQLLNDTTIVGDLRRTNTALADLLIDFKANPHRYIHVSVF
jgi:phospholipid/cholesterol/gamma-HCH transport system substrate-binding protein